MPRANTYSCKLIKILCRLFSGVRSCHSDCLVQACWLQDACDMRNSTLEPTCRHIIKSGWRSKFPQSRKNESVLAFNGAVRAGGEDRARASSAGRGVRRLSSTTLASRLGLGLGALLVAACSAAGERFDSDEITPDELHSGFDMDARLLGFPLNAADAAQAPLLLSQTGAFANLDTLHAADDFVSYRVQSPLFSDGAQKRRWFSLPPEGHIGFSKDAAWSFPEGTIFAKHFGMALDERYPDEESRLETRFLVAGRDGSYYGLVYKWDEDQADARLIQEGGEEQLEIIGADGASRTETYAYPAQNSCGQCHSAAAGYVMGLRTAQINGDAVLPNLTGMEAPAALPDFDPSGSISASGPAPRERATIEPGATNQLVLWSDRGLFDVPIDPAELDEFPRLAPLDDESVLMEHRIRSYWDSNCSMCHNPASPPGTWDARIGTPLADQGLVGATPKAGPHSDGVLLVTPGDPELSLMYLRVNSTEPGVRMPPILRNRVDQTYVALLERWIVSLVH
jgi:hypothetical protein